MNAKFKKLHSGRWGVEVQGHASAGQSLVVVKYDGSEKTVRVERVIWGGKDRDSGLPVSLCTIRREDKAEEDKLPTADRLSACANCGQPFAEHSLSWAVDASGVRDKVCTHCEGPGYVLSFA